MLLAIDPGYKNIGYCIGDVQTNSVVASGTIVTTGNYFPGQLLQIYNQLSKLITTYKVRVIVYEKPTYAVGHETGNKVQQGIAVILLVAALNNITTIVTFKPSEIKLKVAGKGNADKEEVKQGVLKYFPKVTFNMHHESDALAIFISYLINADSVSR